MKKILYFFIALLFCVACKENEDIVTVYEIDPSFELQVNRFYDEAAARGIILSKDNLIVRFGDPGESFLCGSCNTIDTRSNRQKIVTINDQNVCWSNTPDKEALIFHELGHCLLGRRHFNDKFPNGDPKSIMVENSIRLYSPCTYAIGDLSKCNQTHKREYYVNEMFDQSTPTPYWSND